ncbi:hypothetical protein LRAMOSA10888 [Lichtheimia ramosa]|uniref:Right handed beta helix domain-containing protein n=1 Tax=Lichtheimia ramosa TaxID=688394 RepID=A0A077WR08_9FUNG|nr:hypothetical protein LRAMOSA10888 [Lichtheimia ramosa]
MRTTKGIGGFFLTTALSLLSTSVAAAPEINCDNVVTDISEASTIQDMIDNAAYKGQSVVNLAPGIYSFSENEPIVLKAGVSLHADDEQPTIFVGPEGNSTATISVPADNQGWSIKGIVFDNVNIVVDPHTNEDESSVLGNLFLNGGRGSVISNYGQNLYIDGNVFLRDYDHRGTELFPKYDTTNAGVVFQTQKSSVVSNNIFGMDLREADNVYPHVSPQLQHVMDDLAYYRQCHQRQLSDEQGYLASGVQLYTTVDITIKENILNATLPDRFIYGQDHAISVVGSNQTYIQQNFFAGWELADFGGAVRFTSAVDGYVVSNYLANDAIMMYAATHADFMQVSNMVVYNNFFYKFIGNELAPPEPLNGWLYEGITFFDFYTARLNYTIMPPIWNSTVPISPWGWHIVLSENKFGAAEGLDPNVISLGNLDPSEAFIDHSNCYVTPPLLPGSEHGSTIPLLWRQTFEPGVYTQHGGKVPKKFDFYTNEPLIDNVPANMRNLPIPEFWKAFTLHNSTIPMMNPETPCYAVMEDN